MHNGNVQRLLKYRVKPVITKNQRLENKQHVSNRITVQLQWSALPKILSWLDHEFQQIRIQANFEKKCRNYGHFAPWLDRSKTVPSNQKLVTQAEFGWVVGEITSNNLYAHWSELTWSDLTTERSNAVTMISSMRMFRLKFS